eukprot:1178762-Prorocentrum_minimum.AAC.2
MPKRKGKNFNSQPKFTGASGTQATPAAPSSCAKQPTTAGIYTPKPSQVEVLEAQIRVFVGRETDYHRQADLRAMLAVAKCGESSGRIKAGNWTQGEKRGRVSLWGVDECTLAVIGTGGHTHKTK